MIACQIVGLAGMAMMTMVAATVPCPKVRSQLTSSEAELSALESRSEAARQQIIQNQFEVSCAITWPKAIHAPGKAQRTCAIQLLQCAPIDSDIDLTAARPAAGSGSAQLRRRSEAGIRRVINGAGASFPYAPSVRRACAISYALACVRICLHTRLCRNCLPVSLLLVSSFRFLWARRRCPSCAKVRRLRHVDAHAVLDEKGRQSHVRGH
jgi:hypothetical protein